MSASPKLFRRSRRPGIDERIAPSELHLACGTRARFRGPVHPDEEGRFQLADRATHFYGSFGMELVGQVQGARLSVRLTEIYEGSRETTEEASV